MNNGVVRDRDNNFSRHQTFKDGVTIEGGLTVDITGGSNAEETADFTAEVGKVYIVDTSSAAITATLPASPAALEEVTFMDGAKTFNSNALTVNTNGKKLDGATVSTKVHTTKGGAFKYIYRNATYGWLLKAFIFMLFALNVHAGDFTYEMNSWEQDSGLSIGTDKLKPRTAGGLLSIADSAGTTVATITTSAMTITTATITGLTATTGSISTLTSTTGNITGLTATTGSISTLTSTTGNITGLTATTGSISTLTSTTGNITGLTATTGSIGTLDVSTSQIGTLSLTTALTVPNGGTGLSTLAAGRIPYGAGNAPLASSTNLFWDSVNSRLGIQQSAPILPLELNVYGGLDGNPNQFLIRNNIYYDAVDGRTEHHKTGYGTEIGMSNQLGIIKFSTAPSGASGDYAPVTERVRIANDGNFGIGTTAPAKKLEVSDTTGAQARLSYTAGSAYADFTVNAGGDLAIAPSSGKSGIGTNTPQSALHIAGSGTQILTIQNTNDNVVGYISSSEYLTGHLGLGTTSNHPIRFDVNNTEKMRLTSVGKLGIGTATPAELLSVEGAIVATGYKTVITGVTHTGLTTDVVIGTDTFRYSNGLLTAINP